MFNTKKEFLKASNQASKAMIGDLAKRISDFMSENDLDVDDLSTALSVDVDEIDGLLAEEPSEVSMDAFTKFIVATEHAVMMVPLSEVPQGSQPVTQEQEDDEETPWFDDDDEEEEETTARPTNENYKHQRRDANGRFVRNQTKEEELEERGGNLAEMTEDELLDIIEDNGWTGLRENAGKQEMIGFILANQDRDAEQEEAPVQEQDEQQEDDADEADFLAFAHELRHNPTLRNLVRRIVQ